MYSKSHIEKVFKDVYNLRLVDEHMGDYKYYRYNKCHTYNVIDSDNNLVMEHVTLQALGNYLISKNEY